MKNGKIAFSFLMAAIIAVNSWASATVNVSAKARSYLDNAKNVRPALYEIQSKIFTAGEVQAHLDCMTSRGFSWNINETVNGSVMYRNETRGQYLIHDPKTSGCSFWNREVPPLDRNTAVDTTALQAKADGFLQDFLGADAANFKFVNKEYQFGGTAADPAKRVEYLAFRYVRVLDGRLVLDNTCQARITVGDKGAISRFDIRTPRLVKSKDLTKELKAGSIGAYLTNKINSDKYSHTPDGETIAWKSVNVVDGTASYFSEIRGSKRYLIPSSTFYAINQFQDDKTIGSTINISMDGESIPNVKDEDVIDYVKNQPKY
jgi:hypothetical protein